jgi:transcriptional adapter 2-alpha
MRKRRDFDYEYDYDLDEVLAEMEFFSDENEEEIEYKDKMIKYYLNRQEERIERKQFVIERGLLDIKKQPSKPSLEKKKTKEERDIVNSMKIFSRFIKPQDHERMVNNLIKER